MQIENNVQRKQVQYTKMFLNQVKSMKGLSGSDIMVFLVLKCFENKDTRESYPSVKTIIEHTGISRGSVLRAFQKLKDKGLIKAEGKTHLNVNRWSFTSIRSETTPSIKPDTTPVSDPRPPSINPDTTPVSDLIYKSNKLTAKEITNITVSTEETCLLAETDDEVLFLQLWEKWNQHNLFKWSCIDTPLMEWRSIKKDVKDSIKDKDLLNELVCIDIFCMQQWMNKTGGKDYSGSPAVWSDQRWIAGITKWLSSETASYINAQKKPYLKYAISLERPASQMVNAQAVTPPEAVQKKQGDNKVDDVWRKRLMSIYEAFDQHGNQHLLKTDFKELYDLLFSSCTPKELKAIKADTAFYEMFYTVEEEE